MTHGTITAGCKKGSEETEEQEEITLQRGNSSDQDHLGCPWCANPELFGKILFRM
jgi:hypothetical protein